MVNRGSGYDRSTREPRGKTRSIRRSPLGSFGELKVGLKRFPGEAAFLVSFGDSQKLDEGALSHPPSRNGTSHSVRQDRSFPRGWGK